ncbi:hypothetical protein UPYG_G00248700 [Umbra pygmaea]|uniref:Interleukin-17F-like n=1 Tax=Umbra pygmaea TaxID=75934 RepID=A0ABD0W750_UMBPY
MFFRGLLVLVLVALVHGLKTGQKNKEKRDKNSGKTTWKLDLDPKIDTHDVPVSSIANRSLSPWTSGYTHDESRFPEFMAQAQCLKAGCLTASGVEDMALESKPISYQTLVLRRVQKKNGSRKKGKKDEKKKRKEKYFYRLETEIVTVGCTCVRPSLLHQN